MKKPTIKDVAALANVSVGTVSMTLNNSPKISDDTKKNVMEAVEKLGYRRDPFARSLSLSTSRTIGFLVPDLTNPFYGEMTGFLQQEIENRNHGMMLGLTNENSRQEAKLVDMMLDHGVDGLVIVPVLEESPRLKHLYNLLNTSFPVVFLGTYYKQMPINCVMADLSEGTYKITKRLIETGHSNIILISGSEKLVAFSERIKGFRQAFSEYGVAFDESRIVVIEGMSYKGGYSAIGDIYDRLKPDAIVAINDVMAMGVIGKLKSKGIRVPEDVSVAGYDDISISSIQETPLTTVHQPLKELCSKAIDMLFKQIDKVEGADSIIKLPVTPIYRNSTRN